MEYTKTDFFNNYFKKLISEDDLNNRYSSKLDYSMEIEGIEMTDLIKKVKNDLNKVNKDINLKHEYSDLDAIHLIKDSFSENYWGKLIIEIPIAKMYQLLVENYGLKSEKECTFYRIEHNKSGLGLYTHFNELNINLNQLLPFNENIQISPQEDGALKLLFRETKIREKYLGDVQFGFLDHKQIDNWFDSMIVTEDDLEYEDFVEDRIKHNFTFNSIHELLLEHDFDVVEYNVSENHILKTDKQIIFDKNSATIKNRISIKDYFKGYDEKFKYNDNISKLNQEDIDVVKTFLKNSNNSLSIIEKKRTKKHKRKDNNQLDLF